MIFFSKIQSDEHGQNLIEFALIIPIFIWLLMGMVDFGWYLKLSHDLTRANAQGARAAAYSADDSEIKAAIIEAISTALPIASNDIVIVREDFDKSRGTSVEVSSKSTYHSITGFSPVKLLLDDKLIQSSTIIRIE